MNLVGSARRSRRRVPLASRLWCRLCTTADSSGGTTTTAIGSSSTLSNPVSHVALGQVIEAATEVKKDDHRASAAAEIGGEQEQWLEQDEVMTFQTGAVAGLASGAVVVRDRDMSMIVTATAARFNGSREGQSFLPLTVDFREKLASDGRIPQTFMRREFHNSDAEVATARVIDRSVRSLFPSDYVHESQILASVLSYDADADAPVVAINGASAALCLSDLPWDGPVGAARVGLVNGNLVVGPSADERARSDMDLLVTGTDAGEVVMLELVSRVDLPNDVVASGLEAAQGRIDVLAAAQKRFAARAGREKRTFGAVGPSAALVAAAHALGYDRAVKAATGGGLGISMEHKPERSKAQAIFSAGLRQELKTLVLSGAIPGVPVEPEGSVSQDTHIRMAVDAVFKSAVRDMMLHSDAHLKHYLPAAAAAGDTTSSMTASDDDASKDASPLPPRFDGRNSTTVRRVLCETGVLPVVHGSALFSRGDTQVLCTATLGPRRLALTQPNNLTPMERAFILHYDFPPYSINDTGRVIGQNRRMVGHGRLAERALQSILPRSLAPRMTAAPAPVEEADPEEEGSAAAAVSLATDVDDYEYPFAVRLNAEVMASDGSSSMATVAAGSLALHHAGVPISKLAAGVSIGLVRPPATPSTVNNDLAAQLAAGVGAEAAAAAATAAAAAAASSKHGSNSGSGDDDAESSFAQWRAQDPLYRVLRLVEFSLSDANLRADRYLCSLVSLDDGYVSLKALLGTDRLASLVRTKRKMLYDAQYAATGGWLPGQEGLDETDETNTRIDATIFDAVVTLLRGSPLLEARRSGDDVFVRLQGQQPSSSDAVAAGEDPSSSSPEYCLLTDIIGMEDHFGDMDFKIAGTRDGVTAAQLDVKSPVPRSLLVEALAKGDRARQHILDEMEAAVRSGSGDANDGGSSKVLGEQGYYQESQNTPRHVALPIDDSRRGDVIGPGGRTIKRLVEDSGCEIDLQDGGPTGAVVHIFAKDAASAERATALVRGITEDGDSFEQGQSYEMEVKRVEAQFAIVGPASFSGYGDAPSGLLHVSEMAFHRVGAATDEVQVGDKLTVTCMECNGRRAKFTRKPHLDGGAGRGDARGGGQEGRASPPSTPPPDVGEDCEVVVRRLVDYGAFVEVCDANGEPTGHEGLMHISTMAKGFVSAKDVPSLVHPDKRIRVRVVKGKTPGKLSFSWVEAEDYDGAEA